MGQQEQFEAQQKEAAKTREWEKEVHRNTTELENERYEAELKLKKEQLEFERQLQKNTQIKEIEKAQTELADWEKELIDVDAKLAAAKLENNYEQPGLPNYSS